MIKNQKQAAITRERLAELNIAKAEFERQAHTSLEHNFGLDSLNSLIDDALFELKQYDDLLAGKIGELKDKSLENISDIFVSARLAQNISQKHLAEKLNINEQQIQRYESTDYESASLTRLLEVANSLDLNLKFNAISILGCKVLAFGTPSNISADDVYQLEKQVKTNGFSLM